MAKDHLPLLVGIYNHDGKYLAIAFEVDSDTGAKIVFNYMEDVRSAENVASVMIRHLKKSQRWFNLMCAEDYHGALLLEVEGNSQYYYPTSGLGVDRIIKVALDIYKINQEASKRIDQFHAWYEEDMKKSGIWNWEV